LIPADKYPAAEKVEAALVDDTHDYHMSVKDLKSITNFLGKTQETDDRWGNAGAPVEMYVAGGKIVIESPLLDSHPSRELTVPLGEGAPFHASFSLRHLTTLLNSVCGDTLILRRVPESRSGTFKFTSTNDGVYQVKHYIASLCVSR